MKVNVQLFLDLIELHHFTLDFTDLCVDVSIFQSRFVLLVLVHSAAAEVGVD